MFPQFDTISKHFFKLAFEKKTFNHFHHALIYSANNHPGKTSETASSYRVSYFLIFIKFKLIWHKATSEKTSEDLTQ